MTGGAELKLLGTWPSPFVQRVKIALHLKRLKYDNIEEDLLGDKSELLLKYNPVHKKVPVLIHNGKPVCESMIIVEYIDEVFAGNGPSILPSDPYDRAVTRFWTAYIDDKFVSSWRRLFWANTDEEKAEAVKNTFAALEMLEGAFKECSKGKVFFGGDSIGYVDVALGGFLRGLDVAEALSGVKFVDAARTPLLAAWAERFCAVDAARAGTPDADRLLEFTKMWLAQVVGAAAAKN